MCTSFCAYGFTSFPPRAWSENNKTFACQAEIDCNKKAIRVTCGTRASKHENNHENLIIVKFNVTSFKTLCRWAISIVWMYANFICGFGLSLFHVFIQQTLIRFHHALSINKCMQFQGKQNSKPKECNNYVTRIWNCVLRILKVYISSGTTMKRFRNNLETVWALFVSYLKFFLEILLLKAQ